jgi:hypothetical protein
MVDPAQTPEVDWGSFSAPCEWFAWSMCDTAHSASPDIMRVLALSPHFVVSLEMLIQSNVPWDDRYLRQATIDVATHDL